MKYNPPPGSLDPNAPFITGTPGITRGSPICGEALEHPQREILAVITGAGLTPEATDLTQLFKAITSIVEARDANAPGDVIMYNGAFMPDNITPKHATTGLARSGWRLCDGGGGTPDLRDVFVRGATPQTAGQKGGTEKHRHTTSGSITETVATGTIVNTTPGNVGLTTLDLSMLPWHKHGLSLRPGSLTSSQAYLNGGVAGTGNSDLQYIDYAGSSLGHTHSSPAHTHTYTGTAHTHVFVGNATSETDHLPPYYNICYIMKL